jgi:starch synthase (maltosyl-transferring)
MQPLPEHVPSRVVIEGVDPEIDGGRFPIKRTVGEEVVVEADIFADGHDLLAAVLRYRPAGDEEWAEVGMTPLVNDRWTARFTATVLGRYEYTVQAWIDHFASWRRDLTKKVDAGQDVGSDLLEGAELVRRTARRPGVSDADWLRGQADRIARGEAEARVAAALDPALAAVMARHADRSAGAVYDRTLQVKVDAERARFGAWYELFPRSTAAEPGRHGTFRDVEKRLPYVAAMGFDVLYLPPIHPIGRALR